MLFSLHHNALTVSNSHSMVNFSQSLLNMFFFVNFGWLVSFWVHPLFAKHLVTLFPTPPFFMQKLGSFSGSQNTSPSEPSACLCGASFNTFLYPSTSCKWNWALQASRDWGSTSFGKIPMLYAFYAWQLRTNNAVAYLSDSVIHQRAWEVIAWSSSTAFV